MSGGFRVDGRGKKQGWDGRERLWIAADRVKLAAKAVRWVLSGLTLKSFSAVQTSHLVPCVQAEMQTGTNHGMTGPRELLHPKSESG